MWPKLSFFNSRFYLFMSFNLDYFESLFNPCEDTLGESANSFFYLVNWLTLFSLFQPIHSVNLRTELLLPFSHGLNSRKRLISSNRRNLENRPNSGNRRNSRNRLNTDNRQNSRQISRNSWLTYNSCYKDFE